MAQLRGQPAQVLARLQPMHLAIGFQQGDSGREDRETGEVLTFQPQPQFQGKIRQLRVELGQVVLQIGYYSATI